MPDRHLAELVGRTVYIPAVPGFDVLDVPRYRTVIGVDVRPDVGTVLIVAHYPHNTDGAVRLQDVTVIDAKSRRKPVLFPPHRDAPSPAYFTDAAGDRCDEVCIVEDTTTGQWVGSAYAWSCRGHSRAQVTAQVCEKLRAGGIAVRRPRR